MRRRLLCASVSIKLLVKNIFLPKNIEAIIVKFQEKALYGSLL